MSAAGRRPPDLFGNNRLDLVPAVLAPND